MTLRKMSMAALLVMATIVVVSDLEAEKLKGLSGEYREIAPGHYSQIRNPNRRLNTPIFRGGYGRQVIYTPRVRPITIDTRSRKKGAKSRPSLGRRKNLNKRVSRRKRQLERDSRERRSSIEDLSKRQAAALSNMLRTSGGGARVSKLRRRESNQAPPKQKDLLSKKESPKTRREGMATNRRKRLSREQRVARRRARLEEAVAKRKRRLNGR